MLYLKNGEWALCPHKVKYEQRGKVLEQYTHDKKWWIDFADKWDHTKIIEFTEITYTDEQLARLTEIQHIKEGFEYYAACYVLENKFPNELENEEERMDHHPLKSLQIQKENISQGQTITEAEIENMKQGQKQTDFELRLLALEVN